MKNLKNVPSIRFSGFNEPWEQRKFEELFSERRDKTNIENEDTLLSCAIEGMFLNSELFSHFRGSSNIGYIKVKKNDLILSTQNLHLGNANVNLRFKHGIISPAYKVYDLIECDSNFIQAWIKKANTKKFFLKATTEGASGCRKNVEWKTLYKQTLTIPVKKEQKLIGEYFKQIDNLITLHQRKLDKLKKLKKALLEKMFPKDGENIPEIRFKNFTEAWEQRKLIDEVVLFKGLTYSPSDISNTGCLVLRSSNVKNGEIVSADNVYVNYSAVNTSNVKKGDIIIVVRNGSRDLIGKHAQIKKEMPKTVIGAFMTGFHTKNSEFINSLLDSNKFKKEVNKNLGATINQITNGMFNSMEFLFPDSQEQSRIGSIFHDIDNLITLHQRKLDKLENIKKSLLDKMFV